MNCGLVYLEMRINFGVWKYSFEKDIYAPKKNICREWMILSKMRSVILMRV
jgi:hypothetical protein